MQKLIFKSIYGFVMKKKNFSWPLDFWQCAGPNLDNRYARLHLVKYFQNILLWNL